MDNLKRRRQSSQFGLRKVMLWTVVWALSLGMLRALGAPPVHALALTLFLVALLAVRAKWGFGVWTFVMLTMGWFPPLYMLVYLLSKTAPEPPYVLAFVLLFLGFPITFVGFLIVHVLVTAIGRIDDWMRHNT